jgi:hypothetical protein
MNLSDSTGPFLIIALLFFNALNLFTHPAFAKRRRAKVVALIRSLES